jgi:putative Holliday junction resolvase
VGEQITNSCSTYFSKKFKNRKELVEKIKNLITEWDINTIVIGLPLNMDNSESEMSLEIRNFSKKLEKDINIKINFVDEKLTTYEAKQIMKDLNKNKQYIEKNNHGLAAKLILDSFMRDKK